MMTRARDKELTLADVRPTDLLRLDEAARLAFPDGSIGLSGLRREAARGRLATFKIAGKVMTTLEEIAHMVDRCRVASLPPPPPVNVYRRHEPQSGEAGHPSIALQAALQLAQRIMDDGKKKEAEKREAQKQEFLRLSKPTRPLRGRK